MKVLYTRVSSIDQNLDRQKVKGSFDKIVEDKCSGAIPFFERQGGVEILKYIDHNILNELHVWEIDRLGRNLRDILNTIHFFLRKEFLFISLIKVLERLTKTGKRIQLPN